MSNFRDRPFSQRFKALGDEAEGVFERTYPEGWVRFGINRPPINLSKVPAFVRYSPDYLTGRGLVEVQGFGADQTFKLKIDKMQALLAWERATEWRVDIFAYDSKFKRTAWVRLNDLVLATRLANQREFPEGKPYLAWSATDLPICAGWDAVV